MTSQPANSGLRTLGYAAFLACSWTWCIGMYLPVILLRDFGAWSFLVFAAPNCLGAAAMGVFLWRRNASERFLAEHWSACRAFSMVTVAFQVWFLTHLAMLGRSAEWIAGGVLAGIVLGVVAARPRFTGRAVASIVAMFASLGLVGWWLAGAGAPAERAAPSEGPLDLLGLAPVCVMGFALSPYLDLTFHAARQSAPGRSGSRAFLVGFLLFFPLMISLTLAYGRFAVAADPLGPLGAIAGAVAAHMALQLAFTSAVHIPGIAGAAPWWRSKGVAAVVLVAAGLAAGTRWGVPREFTYAGLSAFEIVYRLFMAFYGLVFPAYVLLCGVGAQGIRARPDARAWIVLGAAVCAAAPCYWMGFIERESLWLVPGVFLWVAAKAFLPARPAP